MAEVGVFLLCPNRHRIDDVTVYCRQCKRLVLIRTDEAGAQARVVQLIALVVATLGATLLFRATNQVWPAYLYLCLGLTFLYATIFSRGRGTLAAGAGALSLVTVTWFGWLVAGHRVHLSGLAAAARYTLPPVILLLSLALVWLTRRWMIPVAVEPATYLLMVGVFTLGFWGVWAALLQGGLVTARVYQLTLALGYLSPIAFIPLIRRWRPYADSQQGSLIIWLAIVAAYLMVADLVIGGLGAVLGQLLPHILGLPPLTQWHLQLAYRDVRTGLTVAALGIILLTALIQSIVTVSIGFRRAESIHHTPSGPMQPATGATGSVPLIDVANPVKAAMGSSAFVQEVARDFGFKFRGFARLINLLVPVAVFTALSIMFILVLDALREYNIYGAYGDPVAVWGMALLTMFLTLAACAIAIHFCPWPYMGWAKAGQDGRAKDEDATGGNTRARNWRSVVNGSALLMSAFLVLVSVASMLILAVWVALWATGSRIRQLFAPGPIYLANLTLVAFVVLALLVISQLGDYLRRSERDRSPVPADAMVLRVARAAQTFPPLILTLLVTVATVFGSRPMIQVGSFVLQSHHDTAERRLQAVAPLGPEDRCSQDRWVLTPSLADLSCVVPDNRIVLSYHLFATTHEMNQVYTTILNEHGVDPTTDSCSARGLGPATNVNGNVGCYTGLGRAWIAWTDEQLNVLGLCYEPGGDEQYQLNYEVCLIQ